MRYRRANPGELQRGDKVRCNGNPDGVVVERYTDTMVNVRLWDGLRQVGMVCVSDTSCEVPDESYPYGSAVEVALAHGLKF